MRILTYFWAVALIAALSATTHAQTLVGDGSGVLSIQYLSTTGTNPGNNTGNWNSVWGAIDGGATGTGIIGGFNVNNNFVDTEINYDYAGGGGNFPVNNAFATINMDGPGGAGGPTQGDNYSIRGQTILEFTAAGTYTISLGSDDGRRIELTEAAPGSAPGYTGFLTRGDQFNDGPEPAFAPGDTVIGFDGGTGHNQTVGTFTAAAGDFLALDAFYYEGGGGDSGEISIASGAFGSFTNTTDFNLLQDGALGGAIQLHTTAAAVPEPATIAIWSLLGLALAGFGYRQHRSK